MLSADLIDYSFFHNGCCAKSPTAQDMFCQYQATKVGVATQLCKQDTICSCVASNCHTVQLTVTSLYYL